MAALIRGDPPKKEGSSEQDDSETQNTTNGAEKMDTEDGRVSSPSKKKKEGSERKKRSRSRSRWVKRKTTCLQFCFLKFWVRTYFSIHYNQNLSG